jgi:hypothetical protein
MLIDDVEGRRHWRRDLAISISVPTAPDQEMQVIQRFIASPESFVG